MRARCYTFLSLLFLAIPMHAAPQRITVGSHSLLVSLPRSYDTGDQRYPVVYLTDGETQLEHTVATATALSDVQRMPEVIVVGVLHNDRARELADPKLITWFETELIPAIDKRYRTHPYRVFAGHSLGAVFGLNMLFTRPQLFNAWIIVSPPAKEALLRRAREFMRRNPDARPMLWLMVGGDDDADLQAGVTALGAILPSKPVVFGNDDHLTVPIIGNNFALRRIFLNWFFRIVDEDDPETLYPNVLRHYEWLTRDYGFEVLVPAGRYERIARRLVDCGYTGQAIGVLEEAVERYPGSQRLREALAASSVPSPSRSPRR